MNKFECDVLNNILEQPYTSQRMLAELSGHSLGTVNRAVKSLMDQGYLNRQLAPTEKAREESRNKSPRNAIILAAGFGMRMVPINYSVPKGLLEIHGQILIERLIKQLQEAGIRDITVVAGYMKERFEYLIDEFGVDLVVNPEYAMKNNLHSLNRVKNRLGNTYLLPADLWCEKNPFRKRELYSWYMVSDAESPESEVKMNRKGELILTDGRTAGHAMIGIAYLQGEDARLVAERTGQYAADPANDRAFWEKTLFEKNRMFVQGRMVSAGDVVEINTYEQLKELDSSSSHLRSDTLDLIAGIFHTAPDQITGIEVLKKGMTNRSFLFCVDGKKYIMRIPGEGTDQLINRRQEAEVFRTISGKGLCDDPVYINPENGYKITAFLENARVCGSDNEQDLKRCMKKLRAFHDMKLVVGHRFDIFAQIELYESLWEGKPSVYKDYARTKEHVFSLRDYIDRQDKDWCLTHIDAVCDNFLFYRTEGKEQEQLQLTDWEYAGMQDPHVDIAMFSIYSLYDKPRIDRLIDLYFEDGCTPAVRAKIYCYVAACGLLWSDWTEYKSTLGVEFGEYGLRQYRFAKDFYRYALEEMKKESR